jgi:hypothetical protein
MDAKQLQLQEKEKLKHFLLKQMNDRSKMQFSDFIEEQQNDVNLQTAYMRDFDFKYKLKMDR